MTVLLSTPPQLLRWLPRARFPSEVAFALTVSAVWLLGYNLRFWTEVFGALWHPDFFGMLFVVALAALLLFVQALLLLLVPGRSGLKAIAALLCLTGSASTYFTSRFGTLMNVDMIRNVFQTDAAEAGDLLGTSFFVQVAVTGLIPAILLWRAVLPPTSWRRQLAHRGAFFGIGLAACLALALASSASYAVLLREHKPLRSMLSPVSAVWSTGVYLAGQLRAAEDRSMLPDPGGVPWRPATSMPAATRRPMLLVLVVGETARAANFQLGGYTRETTPALAARSDIYYFSNAISCGTSTAISIPCMFSQGGRRAFVAAIASRIPNLLDVLSTASVDVTWLDNNSGCKSVCARVATLEYGAGSSKRPTSPACSVAHCFDDVLGEGLAARLMLSQSGKDQLIVLHQNGSHGPAYSERYPASEEHFRPACHSNRLDSCSREQVVNAYDNSIRYTDKVLAAQIAQLEALQREFDSVLIYVSDHGESLGEQGIYLHGMPYAFAPDVQKHVPLLIWMSQGFRQRNDMDGRCLAKQQRSAVSHDNLFSSVMGAFGLRNRSYRPELDLISRCATGHGRMAAAGASPAHTRWLSSPVIHAR